MLKSTTKNKKTGNRFYPFPGVNIFENQLKESVSFARIESFFAQFLFNA